MRYNISELWSIVRNCDELIKSHTSLFLGYLRLRKTRRTVGR